MNEMINKHNIEIITRTNVKKIIKNKNNLNIETINNNNNDVSNIDTD